MIAIQSKRELNFPPSYKGFVTMRIDLIQNKPDESLYELRIIDTCFIIEQKEVPEIDDTGKMTGKLILKKSTVLLGKPFRRYKTLSYDELDQLAKLLPVDMTDKTKLRENINELFRQGLLFITQQECQNNEGQYFTKATDWEIIRE